LGVPAYIRFLEGVGSQALPRATVCLDQRAKAGVLVGTVRTHGPQAAVRFQHRQGMGDVAFCISSLGTGTLRLAPVGHYGFDAPGADIGPLLALVMPDRRHGAALPVVSRRTPQVGPG
jgi:hypothetical protein